MVVVVPSSPVVDVVVACWMQPLASVVGVVPLPEPPTPPPSSATKVATDGSWAVRTAAAAPAECPTTATFDGSIVPCSTDVGSSLFCTARSRAASSTLASSATLAHWVTAASRPRSL